jgi:hypothetical protein
MAKTPRNSAAEPNWSTLEQQLAASKVIPGSALERLIRDNQQLEMLRPEEIDDRLGLPPWLRVHWRKLHPDGKYFGPSGGYPLVLERLFDWMIAHQDLPGYDPTGGSGGRPTGGQHGN